MELQPYGTVVSHFTKSCNLFVFKKVDHYEKLDGMG